MIFQNICILGLLIFVSFGECHLSLSKKLNSTYLITGGLPKDNHDLGKFVVSLRHRTYIKPSFGYHHYCGGTIISPTTILTAAHCLTDNHGQKLQPFQLVVVVGSRNLFTHSDTTREMDVDSVIKHKVYGKSNLFCDVGFLILKDEIKFDNPHVGIINLASFGPQPYKICTVIGWGRLYDDGPLPDRILFADVQIQSFIYCKLQYGSTFTAGMLCAGDPVKWETNACKGDSGGPLVCDNAIAGIVSYGFRCLGPPAVYTDVYFFRDWILENKGSMVDADYIVVIFLSSIVLNKGCQRLWGS